MVKTKGPLFSLSASGSIGKVLNYSKRKSGPQVRKHHKPSGDPSQLQRGMRRLTEFIVAQWVGMSAPDKETWNVAAREQVKIYLVIIIS